MKNKRNEADFQTGKARLEYLKQEENKGKINLYYFDESGFSQVPSIPYAWQLIGETREIPSQRSKRINVLGFLSRKGDFFYRKTEGSTKTETVIEAFDDFIQNYWQQGKKLPCFIMIDNASMHTSHVFQAQIKRWEAQQIHVFYLPKYSPELNLIEILWRKIKYEWMPLKAFESYANLKKEVHRILEKCRAEKLRITFA